MYEDVLDGTYEGLLKYHGLVAGGEDFISDHNGDINNEKDS